MKRAFDAIRAGRMATVFAAAAVSAAAVVAGADEPDLLPPAAAFAATARVRAGGSLEYRVDVKPGYHLYRDRVRAEWIDTRGKVHALELTKPAGKDVDDPTFGRIAIYDQGVVMAARLPAANGAGRLEVVSQGCAKAGICFPPHRQTFHPAVADAWVGPTGEAKASSMRSLLGRDSAGESRR